MASSLKELLAEEGFKGRREITRSRSSGMPFHGFPDKHKNDSAPEHRNKTERTRSGLARYSSKSEPQTSDDIRGKRSVENLVGTEKSDERLKKESRERLRNYLKEGKRYNPNKSKDMPGNEIDEVLKGDGEKFGHMHSKKAHSLDWGKNNLTKQLLGHKTSSTNNMKNMKKPSTSNDTSSSGSLNMKAVGDNQSKRRSSLVQVTSEPALDEAAIKAIVSILNGYIKSFVNDEDFRAVLRHNCFSSLDFVELEGGESIESKALAGLQQAIETVEKAAEGSSSDKDLKKASLQLSVITGLYSNNSKDDSESGISYSKLSACAHLYLSVIYKQQKKDKIAAKHLLQVFCNVPFQARTILLPELWDYLFFPHLSHLKEWYNQETDSLADAPKRRRKLKLLDKVYNDMLDSGTSQFAAYYKDWLTEGVEAPSLPSIQIPSVSVWEAQRGSSFCDSSELSNLAGRFSPRPMVSRKLYDSVIGSSSKRRIDEAEDGGETVNSNMSSLDDATVVKHSLTRPSENVECTNRDADEDSINSVLHDAFLHEKEPSSEAEKQWRLPVASDLSQRNLNGESCDPIVWEKPMEKREMPDAAAYADNEVTLRSLAQSVFEQQDTKTSADLGASSLFSSREALTSGSLANPIEARSSLEEFHGSYEFFDEHSFFSSIPQGFTCPLTGKLFEDPVTLETGHTFERGAIKAWFDEGNRECPVTGKTLQSLAVPLTNFVLKRVIDNWRSENCRNLFAFTSQAMKNSDGHGLEHLDETVVILEQLLTAFGDEEKRTNAKHIISLGGLQLLLQWFELGKIEEKARVAELLFCCIQADASCRDQIARNINGQCLLELLQSKQVKSRTNAVLLLTELICLKRWKDVTSFLNSLQTTGITDAMNFLLVYLHRSPKEQRPLIAVLLLHLDLLVEPQKCRLYREEAIDAITVALEDSLVDEDVRENCCRALLILGRRFCFSRKLLAESWILKQAGYKDVSQVNEEEKTLVDDAFSSDDEEFANEEWLRNLSAALLGNGTKSFLATVSKCLGSENLDLVRVCLITVAWLSFALSSQFDVEFQLSAFSALIAGLKETLQKAQQAENRILAAISLLNFSKISEGKILLMTVAEDIAAPLRSLAEVTWTTKQLYAVVSRGDR